MCNSLCYQWGNRDMDILYTIFCVNCELRHLYKLSGHTIVLRNISSQQTVSIIEKYFVFQWESCPIALISFSLFKILLNLYFPLVLLFWNLHEGILLNILKFVFLFVNSLLHMPLRFRFESYVLIILAYWLVLPVV